MAFSISSSSKASLPSGSGSTGDDGGADGILGQHLGRDHIRASPSIVPAAPCQMMASAVVLSACAPPMAAAICTSSGTACTTPLRGQAVHDFGFGQHGPQTVRAQQQHVARLQAGLLRQLDLRQARRRPGSYTACCGRGGWRARTGRRRPRVDQVLEMRVVARARQDLAAAHPVQARVAAVRPDGACCAGSGRRRRWCAASPAGCGRRRRRWMSWCACSSASSRKRSGFFTYGRGLLRNIADIVCSAMVGGDLAAQVAAHAVGQHQQQASRVKL